MTVRALWRGVTFALVLLLLGGAFLSVRWLLGARQLASLAALVSQLHSQGKYKEALPLAEQYVTLARQNYGEEHPEFATAVLWLGAVHHSLGRSAEAEPFVQRALSIYEKTLGPNHSDTAAALNYVAEVYRAQRRYKDAEPIYRACFPSSKASSVPTILMWASCLMA